MAEYINKEAMLKNLTDELERPPIDVDPRTILVMQRFIKYVEDFTAADVQPVKHGRWVQYNRNGEETYIECTNCCVPSRPRHLQMVTRSGEGLPDYCPNCGARMIKDGDTE